MLCKATPYYQTASMLVSAVVWVKFGLKRSSPGLRSGIAMFSPRGQLDKDTEKAMDLTIYDSLFPGDGI